MNDREIASRLGINEGAVGPRIKGLTNLDPSLTGRQDLV